MKHLKEWLTRLASRPASRDHREDYRHQAARNALMACEGHDDWLKLSSHGNGFVREVAVRELTKRPSPEALAALLERLNDWVPRVRQLAAEAVRRYLIPEHAAALLHALPSLMALSERQRADHSPTLTAARAALQSPEVRAEVEAALAGHHGKEARFLFTLMLEASAEPTALLSKALAHREMTVRQMAVAACQTLPAEQARPLLQEAFDRPGASVRVGALRALLPLLDDPRPLLRQTLLDASPSIRALARWAAPHWQVDAREILEAHLCRPAPTHKRDWLGLLGLACELAVELPEPWPSDALQSTMSSVRLAAVTGLGEDGFSHLMTALNDPADKVFAKAVEHLHEQPWTRLKAVLNARLDHDWHSLPPARLAALMHLRPSWQQLAYLLHRLDASNSEQDYWRTQIANWCQKQYLIVDPITTKEERDKLIVRIRCLESSEALPIGCAARIA